MDDDYSAHGDLESNSGDASQADTASLAVVKQEVKMMNVSVSCSLEFAACEG